jgi:hypothetical protein
VNDTDEMMHRLARVHDDELAGHASRPEAQALLDSITATAAPTPTRTSRLRFRLAVGALVAGVAVAAAVVVPTLFPDQNAVVYANSAIELERDGDTYVARIKDPFADHQRYTEAFQAVGIKMDIRLVPTSPNAVGKMIQFGTAVGPSGPSKPVSGGTECEQGQTSDCPIVIKVPVDYAAHGWMKIGRQAKPGETYQNFESADRKGGVMEGVAVREGRKVSEILAEAQRRDLNVVYRLIKVTTGEDGVPTGGMSFESLSPDTVAPDWHVWDAELVKADTVRFMVTPNPLPKNPMYD